MHKFQFVIKNVIFWTKPPVTFIFITTETCTIQAILVNYPNIFQSN